MTRISARLYSGCFARCNQCNVDIDHLLNQIKTIFPMKTCILANFIQFFIRPMIASDPSRLRCRALYISLLIGLLMNCLTLSNSSSYLRPQGSSRNLKFELSHADNSSYEAFHNSYYPSIGYFKPFIATATLLTMTCTDYRFPHCRPILSTFMDPIDDPLHRYNNFNPSFIHIKGKLREQFPYGDFIMVKRLTSDLCQRLNASEMNTTAHHHNGGVLIQIMDEYFRPIAQTLLQYCSHNLIPPLYNSSAVYKPVNQWMDNVHVFTQENEVDPKCGIIAGEDARLLYIHHELWLMYHCYFGSCNPKSMFRVKIKIDVISKSEILAYVVPMTRTELPGGRNFVFFQHQREAYLLYSLRDLVIYRLSDLKPIETKAPIDLSKNWHQHGGMLIHWNTTRNRGYLGIAHQHVNYGQYGLWGYNYVSSMVLISDNEPFEIIKMGKRFCFQSLEFPDKCDTIQFISSISISNDHLVIGYGVNDCETRLWSMTLDEVDDLIGDFVNIPVEGKVYKGTGRTIYLFQNDTFRPFGSFEAFAKMGFDIDDILPWHQNDITSRLGTSIELPFEEGKTYKMPHSRSIYLYREGSFHEFQDFETFAAMGFDTSATMTTSDANIQNHLGYPVPSVKSAAKKSLR